MTDALYWLCVWLAAGWIVMLMFTAHCGSAPDRFLAMATLVLLWPLLVVLWVDQLVFDWAPRALYIKFRRRWG